MEKKFFIGGDAILGDLASPGRFLASPKFWICDTAVRRISLTRDPFIYFMFLRKPMVAIM
jgi:hypothetical protein